MSWFRRQPEPPAAPAHPRAGASPEQLLRRLEWTVLRRLDGLLQGDWRALVRGAGLDLADLREYHAGDDVRHIDWNVTARLQVPHVRIFNEDRDLTAWFLIDLSPSVDFGSGPRTKRALATEFVAFIALLLARRGNRVGAILYGAGAWQFVPAQGGRAHVLRLLRALRERRASAADAAGTLTQLGELLGAAGRVMRRRATVFVVSDFISAPGWERALGRIALHHDTIAVRLIDALERDLPDLGLIHLRDAETGEALLVDTHDRTFRQRFAASAAAREQALRTAFASAGVDALELATDDDLTQAIIRFLDLRRARTSARSGGARALPAHLRRRA